MSTSHTAILILAAGESKRLKNKYKQLLLYKNKTLLEHAVLKALQLSDNVYVVLGAQYESCRQLIEAYKLNIIFNENYQEGMGTSISKGIKNTKEFEKTLIMLVDQPFIPLSHYQKLLETNTNSIVASFYNNSLSVPALFPKHYYKDLLQLNADKGAKVLLKNTNTVVMPLENQFSIDIDTLDEVQKYLS